MKKIFLLSTLALSTSAFAESDPYQACLDKAGASTDGIIELCAEKASDVYKKQITKSYNAIYANYQKADPEKALAFEEAQKSWLVNRNKNCEISDNKQKCLMDLNKERAESLSAKAATLKPAEDNLASTNIPKISTKKDILFEKSRVVNLLNHCDEKKYENIFTISVTMDRTNIDWLDSILFSYILNVEPKSLLTRTDAVKALEKKFKNDSFEEGCTTPGSIGEKVKVELVGQFSKFVTFNFQNWDWYPEYGNVSEDYEFEATFDLVKKKRATFIDIFPKANKKKLEALFEKKIESENRIYGGEHFSIEDDLYMSLTNTGVGIYLGRNQGSVYLELEEVKDLLLPGVKQYIK